jgi:hypothetical protein
MTYVTMQPFAVKIIPNPQALFRLSHRAIAFPSSWPFSNAGARQLHSLSLPHNASLTLGVSECLPLFRPVPLFCGVPDSYSLTCGIPLDPCPRVSIPEQPVFVPEYFLQEPDSQLVPQHTDILLSQLHPSPIRSISEDDIIASPNPWLLDEHTESPFSNTPPLPTPEIDQRARSDPNNQSQFQTLGKKAVICTYNACGTQFSQRWDLKRHHETIHLQAKTFLAVSLAVLGRQMDFRGKARGMIMRGRSMG